MRHALMIGVNNYGSEDVPRGHLRKLQRRLCPMNSRAGIHKFMNMGKEAKFVLIASVALLTVMLLPFTEVYWYGVALSVSAVVAMLMALYGVRLWVRLLAMPFVLIVAIVATIAMCEIDTGSGDADFHAQIFSSRLLMRCPLIGSITQTEEGRKAKAEFERGGDRLDDMRILPWRSYQNRHRRCEVLARLGAKYGLVVPLAILGLHIGLAVLGVTTVWKLKKGVYRAAAMWILAILVAPWICPLLGLGVQDPDGCASFPVPDHLPFINEMPEMLLASVIQLGVFVVALRCGWNREVGCQDKEVKMYTI